MTEANVYADGRFQVIVPGAGFVKDWYDGVVPQNIEVGDNSVADSTFCFKQYFSLLPCGLKIGSNVTLWRTSLAAEENASIHIGDYCYIANASIVCSEHISIGNYVMIAGGVTIADSDFHPVDPASRLEDIIALSPGGKRHLRPPVEKAPVVIEDHVWIGFNATILKGVVIGEGAIIQAGALVLQDVPPFSIVSGNPAKVIGIQE